VKKSIGPQQDLQGRRKETVQECLSEFISFITGEAMDQLI
jgi:histone H3/H4